MLRGSPFRENVATMIGQYSRLGSIWCETMRVLSVGIDPHPNKEGHELLGTGIARTLQQHELLPPAAAGARAAPGPRAHEQRPRHEYVLGSLAIASGGP